MAESFTLCENAKLTYSGSLALTTLALSLLQKDEALKASYSSDLARALVMVT